MPKATLTFTLPEEREEYNTAVHGSDYQAVLWSLDQEYFRPITKHGILPDELMSLVVETVVPPTKEHLEKAMVDYTIEVIDWVRKQLYKELNDHGVEII